MNEYNQVAPSYNWVQVNISVANAMRTEVTKYLTLRIKAIAMALGPLAIDVVVLLQGW